MAKLYVSLYVYTAKNFCAPLQTTENFASLLHNNCLLCTRSLSHWSHTTLFAWNEACGVWFPIRIIWILQQTSLWVFFVS